MFITAINNNELSCEIISVGTEILMGQILNTNASYIAKQLTYLGISSYFQTVVGDNALRLNSALDTSLKRSHIVILTGGLGPTSDDITKDVVCDYFALKPQLHIQSKQHIQSYFDSVGRQMHQNNLKQAMFPPEVMVLHNSVGTAPGLILERDGKVVILLPGPPYEMEEMFQQSVVPFLRSRSGFVLVSRVMRFSGIGEAALEDGLSDLITNGKNPTLALYAGNGEVILRLTSRSNSQEQGESLIDPVEKEVHDRFGQFVYAVGDEDLFAHVISFLKKKGATLAVAESCTGGLISQLLTAVPGCSSVLLLGSVTYSNQAKMDMLGVTEEVLREFGAVSSQCAEQMAVGVRKACNADLGISVTGIAGPSGGTADKPVGLVYIAISSENGQQSTKLMLKGNRNSIRSQAAYKAIGQIISER